MGPDGRGPTPVPRARDRAGPGAGAVGAAGEHLRDVGAAHGPAGTGDRDVARFLGHADLDRTAQCVPGRAGRGAPAPAAWSVSYTHLRAHETRHDLVCRLLLEKKKKK